ELSFLFTSHESRRTRSVHGSQEERGKSNQINQTHFSFSFPFLCRDQFSASFSVFLPPLHCRSRHCTQHGTHTPDQYREWPSHASRVGWSHSSSPSDSSPPLSSLSVFGFSF